MGHQLSNELVNVLEQILELLIPGNVTAAIESGNSPGVMAFLQQALQDDDVLYERIRTLLTAASEPTRTSANASQAVLTADLLCLLESDHPQAFASLLRLTYMAYYSRADARRQLGLGPWPVHPQGYTVAAESAELLQTLTAPVRARGPFYRPC
ncbi:hypothetical protein ACUNV4_15195 [Granulosicoccus sp. 3-233]|uniref:hypothetical protein n=1 Tax=Granulosicoccus sp. 3-233 TaxID=3417969 RepID=UPI003D34329A